MVTKMTWFPFKESMLTFQQFNGLIFKRSKYDENAFKMRLSANWKIFFTDDKNNGLLHNVEHYKRNWK